MTTIRPTALRRSLALAALVGALTAGASAYAQISFDLKTLQFNGNGSISSGTALAFGPDGRLYATEVDGDVKVFTVERNDATDEYEVVASENVTLVKSIPNHDDDGTPGGPNNRQVTGIAVGGTANAVEVYVSSSDKRVGAGGGGGDINLDTNSGVITRLTCPGGFVDDVCSGGWAAVDLVRGLPRSEENHATNGMEVVDIGGSKYLIVASGGFTNAGAPSNNFTFTTEYALSGAVLAVDLTMLEAMAVNIDGGSGRSYVYDLPTLDDPTRANVNGIDDPDDPGYDGVDPGDPWGGNDGLNQAKLVVGGPVQMFSPGYRNTYDLVVTQSGAVYVTDNGANGGWGGYPLFEGTAQVNNDYRPGEPGSSGPDTAGNSGPGTPPDPQVNNDDHLNKVTTDIQSYVFGSVYGGHPAPVRANVDAGLYTRAEENDPGEIHTGPLAGGVCDNPAASFCEFFRTQAYDPDGSRPGSESDPLKALPADWPPVPPELINVDNADFRQPHDTGADLNPDGPEDITVTDWPNNTNGICEYTASNFGGEMQGNLIAGKSGGSLHRVVLDAAGDLALLEANKFSTGGGNPLGVECLGDAALFPGTIWVATFDSRIVVLEPNDFVNCVLPGEPGYDPQGDNDFDGYSNQDEIDNGTEICNGGSQPDDFDDDLLSDLNDADDDGDGIDDAADPLQLGLSRALPISNELFSNQLDAMGEEIGYLGLGLTGLMNNGAPNPNYLDWLDTPGDGPGPDDILGGAIGAVTIQQTGGDALAAQNDQEKAFQLGFDAGPGTGPFTVEARLIGLTEPGQLYPYADAYAGAGTPGHGIQLGTGFQDHYVSLLVTGAGITMRYEADDALVYSSSVPIAAGDRPLSDVLLFLEADPLTGSISGSFRLDVDPPVEARPVGGAAATTVGSTTAQGALLAALQSDQQAIVTGLIGTSADPGAEYGATWEYVFVTAAAPFATQPLPDVERLAGDPPEIIDLDQYFGDDNGTANLTYTVEANSDPAVGASISGSELTLTYPTAQAASDVTVRATDADLLFVDQRFTVTVVDEPVPLIRVNAGGGALTSPADGGPAWQANTGNGAQSGVAYSNNTGNVSTHDIPVGGRHPSIPASITDAEFVSLFANERWDPGAAPEMEFVFDVAPNGNYEVRLYMGNGFNGTSAPGERQFAVSIEGVQVFSNKDLSAEYGHQVGAMEAYQTSVGSDGELNVEWFHQVENPLVNAIEILSLGGAPADMPIVAGAIAGQASFEGATVDLQVVASGGDGALTYAASGLPPALAIAPATGLISGSVDAGAAGASPYEVTITVDDADADDTDVQTIQFQWIVSEAPLPGEVVYRVNAGGPVVADAVAGDWSEDQAGPGGSAGGNAGTGAPSPYVNTEAGDQTFGATVTLTNATGLPDALFLTERFSNQAPPGNMQWDFPLPEGTYEVSLLFAEIFSDGQSPGFRVFDVTAEGSPLLDDYEIFADVGGDTAVVKSFLVTVADGNLDLDFLPVVQNPAIKGIEVRAADPATAASVVLEVNIPGRGGDGNEAVQLAVDLYQFGAVTPTFQFTPTADADGVVALTGIDPETYEIAVRGANTLQRVLNLTLNAGDNGTPAAPVVVPDLLVGDVNGDNVVNILDLSAIVPGFGLSPADAGYDPAADLNGDGPVDILDLSATVPNFDLAGEQPSGLETVR